MRAIVLSGLALAMALSSPVQAEIFGTKNRTKLFKSQTSVLDNRAAGQYKASVRLKPPSVNTPTKWGDSSFSGKYRGRYNGPYLALARAAAQRYNVPEDLFLRLVQQESGFNARAVSPKGALGLAQLMPATAKVLGVDPHDPGQNLEGGARYLAQQYRAFGSWRLALAAYNAGPQAVRKYGGVPPYKETQHYVKVILGS